MSLLSLPVSCHTKKYRLLCWKIPNILCKVLWAYNFKRYWTLKVYFRLIFFSLLLDKYSSVSLGTFYLRILRNTTSKCMHEAMISRPVKHLKSASNHCWISCSSQTLISLTLAPTGTAPSNVHGMAPHAQHVCLPRDRSTSCWEFCLPTDFYGNEHTF